MYYSKKLKKQNKNYSKANLLNHSKPASGPLKILPKIKEMKTEAQKARILCGRKKRKKRIFLTLKKNINKKKKHITYVKWKIKNSRRKLETFNNTKKNLFLKANSIHKLKKIIKNYSTAIIKVNISDNSKKNLLPA